MCGSFTSGNALQLQHGAKALASGRGTPIDHARMAAIEAAVLDDVGGSDECSEVTRQLVADFAFAATLRDLLSAHLAATGPLTRAGKRKAALTSWQQVSARVEALARQIGTDRRPARIPTLAEHVEALQRQREQAAGDEADLEGAS